MPFFDFFFIFYFLCLILDSIFGVPYLWTPAVADVLLLPTAFHALHARDPKGSSPQIESIELDRVCGLQAWPPKRFVKQWVALLFMDALCELMASRRARPHLA